MRKLFDRAIEGEGWLIRRDKAERERKKSDFWGCNWNEVYIVYCDGASFGGMMMMGMMMIDDYLVEALTSMWINVCTSVVGCQSSVGYEVLCTDILLKAY